MTKNETNAPLTKSKAKASVMVKIVNEKAFFISNYQ